MFGNILIHINTMELLSNVISTESFNLDNKEQEEVLNLDNKEKEKSLDEIPLDQSFTHEYQIIEYENILPLMHLDHFNSNIKKNFNKNTQLMEIKIKELTKELEDSHNNTQSIINNYNEQLSSLERKLTNYYEYQLENLKNQIEDNNMIEKYSNK